MSFSSFRFAYASAFSSADGVVAGFGPESAVVVQHLTWNPGLGSITERGIAFAPVAFKSEEPVPFDQIAALFPGIYPGPDFIWRAVADIQLDFTVNYTSCGEAQILLV